MQARMSFWLTGYSSQFLIWMRFGDHHTRWSFFTLIMYSTLLCEWRSITDSIQIRGLTYKRKNIIWTKSYFIYKYATLVNINYTNAMVAFVFFQWFNFENISWVPCVTKNWIQIKFKWHHGFHEFMRHVLKLFYNQKLPHKKKKKKRFLNKDLCYKRECPSYFRQHLILAF